MSPILPSNKDHYRTFCQQQKDMPLFFKDWYLDAVCNEKWNVATIEKGGQIAAALPYFLFQRGPFSIIEMPMLMKFMGPYFAPNFNHLKQVYKLTPQLIDQLPNVARFRQNFYYTTQNWLPWYWKGYQQTTKYSYIIPNLTNLDNVFQNFLPDYRNNKIPKAQEIVTVRQDVDLEEFFNVNTLSFVRQKKKYPLSYPFFKKVYTALSEHQSCQLFAAIDHKQNIHSAALLIWDTQSSYLLMAGDDPELRSSGAGILLTWEMIKYTKNELRLNQFDFLGSMVQPIERVRRNFGAQLKPYCSIQKYHSTAYWFLEKLGKSLKR